MACPTTVSSMAGMGPTTPQTAPWAVFFAANRLGHGLARPECQHAQEACTMVAPAATTARTLFL